MSVQTQINRLTSAKSAIKSAIEANGVTVPASTKLDGYAALVKLTKYSVSITAANCIASGATTAISGQGYSIPISAKSGYAIESVKVTMGGKDITSQVWSGKTVKRGIKTSATKATLDNAATAVIDGQSYCANVTPDKGYDIKSVKVTMGGVDITSQVWHGE